MSKTVSLPIALSQEFPMHNPVPADKINDHQKDLCDEQGGTIPEGSSKDPHTKHEAPCPESGHGSASGGSKKSY